jgi:hypothetical protein
MKLITKTVCILLIFMSAVSFGQEKRYRVIIKSVSPGAKVYINNKFRANTPCGFSAKENFKIKITLQKEGYKTWSNIYTVKNDILINQKLLPTTSKSGYSKAFPLLLDSEPRNAEVYINGELKGSTPFNALIPVWSSVNVTLKKEDFQDWNETILIKNQVSKTVSLKTKSKNTPWLIAGAAIITGGVLTYFATQQDNGSSSSTNWPQPPTRPN